MFISRVCLFLLLFLSNTLYRRKLLQVCFIKEDLDSKYGNLCYNHRILLVLRHRHRNFCHKFHRSYLLTFHSILQLLYQSVADLNILYISLLHRDIWSKEYCRHQTDNQSWVPHLIKYLLERKYLYIFSPKHSIFVWYS